MSDHLNVAWPENGEPPLDYARRLEPAGEEEMLIRAALWEHYRFSVAEADDVAQHLKEARYRHIALVKEHFPDRTGTSLTWKVARNLGVSNEEAEDWLMQFDIWERRSAPEAE